MSPFHAPPPVHPLRVFTRLPDEYRRSSDSEWGRVNRFGHASDSFLEGPSFDREGGLYVTDIPFGRVFRIDAAGKWSLIAEYDGWPNGLKISADGDIVITDHKYGLVRLDPQSGTVSPLIETRHGERFKGVNDLVFGPGGEIYFTDQGQTGMHDMSGRVFRFDPDGTLTQLLDNAPSPNGIALDPGGKALFVAMTRANQIWRIPLHPSGLIGKVGVFLHLPGSPVGPDGIAFDERGNLYIAHAGTGRIWAVSPIGDPIACFQHDGGRMITNLAFGGADRRQLYATESETGTILVADTEVAGFPLMSHRPQ